MNKIAPIFPGKVKNGKLKVSDISSFHAYLLSLPEEVDIIVRPHLTRKSRSNNQNRYYWDVIMHLISEETGHSPDECHEYFRSMFMSERIFFETNCGNLGLSTLKSTTSLNTSEMESYMSKIRMWCAKMLDLSIPEPNEVEMIYE